MLIGKINKIIIRCPPCKKLGVEFDKEIANSKGWNLLKIDVD